jgi:hypothetical protein
MQIIADPATQDALWKRACALSERAIAAIGEPVAIAARTNLSRKTRHEIAGWLALLESIVRKLLLALAAPFLNEARSPGNVGARGLRPRIAPAAQACALDARPQAARPQPELWAPQTWSARFALAPPRDPRAVPERLAPRIRALWGPTPPAPPPPSRSGARHVTEPAVRFAFRLEALKRVLQEPLPYARRLARALARLVRRYPGAAHRYAVAPARPHVFDERDPRLIIDVLAIAMAAAHVFANTS